MLRRVIGASSTIMINKEWTNYNVTRMCQPQRMTLQDIEQESVQGFEILINTIDISAKTRHQEGDSPLASHI